MIDFFLRGLSLALSAISIPGPLQAYLLNISLRHGWRRALLIAITPILTDAPIIGIVVFVLGQLPDSVIQIIRIMGGLVLLWIAWGAYQQLQSGVALSDQSTEPTTNGSWQRVMITAMAMNLLSPGPYLFWATVNGPLLLEALAQSTGHAIAFLLGFYGIFTVGLALLGILFDRIGKIDARVTGIILRVTILFLMWFGTALIFEAFNLNTVHRLTITPLLVLLGGFWFWRRTPTLENKIGG